MIFEIILIILPVLLAGSVFIFVIKNYPNLWRFPIDAGKTFRGKRIFGVNKNIRGPVIMSISTSLFGGILYLTINSTLSLAILLNYFLVGLGYSIGELINSFIKRQLNITPGSRAKEKKLRFLFDLLDNFDSLIMIAFLYYLFFDFSKQTIIIAFLIGGLIHYAIDIFMTTKKLKKKS